MIRIPSKTHNICIIQTYLDKVFEEHNLNRRFFGDVLTSITEAVNNAIIHGNHEDENKFVQINLQRRTDGLVFTIKDEGNGFDPQSIPDPTAQENIELCGGRGIFLINQLSHSVNYIGNGSTVEIVFNF